MTIDGRRGARYSDVSDPQTRAYLERLAASTDPGPATVAEAREAMAATVERSGEPQPVAAVDDRVLDGPGGLLPVRVYRSSDDPAPGVCVYLHGGGFVVGSVEVYDPVCRRLANRSRWVVVSVDYRLAPEHPFPAAISDSDAAVRWAAASGDELGAPGGRLAVAGDSAGGALAAVVARRARDRGEPDVALQVLVYPVTDAACDSPSFARYGVGYDLDAEGMRHDWERYLAGADPADADASPLRASDLSGVAPALVVLAELDPLHDEGLAYAGRLRDAGVEVAVRDYAGQIHGFFRQSAVFDRAEDALRDVAVALQAVASR